MENGQTQPTQSTANAEEHEAFGFEHQVVSNLIQLRKSQRMSQEELAKKLNTKQSVISRVENGASVPSLRFVERVAEALGAEVDVTFKPRSTQDISSRKPSSNNNIEYICVDCLYRWESEIQRIVMQCPQCHKRQGVMFSEYSRALHAYQDIRLQVKKSAPFKKPPPIKSVRNIPDFLKVILETAGNTFPSPKLPISLLFRIIEQSRQEQIKEQPCDMVRGASTVTESYTRSEGFT